MTYVSGSCVATHSCNFLTFSIESSVGAKYSFSTYFQACRFTYWLKYLPLKPFPEICALLSMINYSSIKFVPNCHPEKTKNQAVKQRRFCFVQDLTNYQYYSLIGKMLKYA